MREQRPPSFVIWHLPVNDDGMYAGISKLVAELLSVSHEFSEHDRTTSLCMVLVGLHWLAGEVRATQRFLWCDHSTWD
jgi:hypothetical protein